MELFAIFQTLLFRSSNLSTDLVLNTNEISAGHYLLIYFMLFLSKKSFILKEIRKRRIFLENP